MNDHDLDDRIDPGLEERLRVALRARAELASGVVTPNPATVRGLDRSVGGGSGDRPRNARAALAVAAAVVAVAGIGAAVVVANRPAEVRITPGTMPSTTAVATAVPDTGFVVDGWETSFPRLTGAGHRPGEPSVDVAVTAVLGRGGEPVAFLQVLDQPDLPADAAGAGSVEPVTIGGRQAVTWDNGVTTSFVARLGPGRTVGISSVRDLSIDEVDGLVDAVGAGPARVVASRLPEGWTIVDDPTGVAAVGMSGVPQPVGRTVGSVGASTLDGTGYVGLTWFATDDPQRELDLLTSLWGVTSRPSIAGREGALVPTVADPTRPVLVWPLDDGHVGVLQSFGTTDELRALAGRVRPADRAEWAALVARAAEERTPDLGSPQVSEFAAPAGTTELASGRLEDSSWIVAAVDADPSTVEVIALAGETLLWTPVDAVSEAPIGVPSQVREGELVLTAFTADAEVDGVPTDLEIMIGGVPQIGTWVPLDAGRVVILAVGDALSTPGVEGSAAEIVVTGTAPDGSPVRLAVG